MAHGAIESCFLAGGALSAEKPGCSGRAPGRQRRTSPRPRSHPRAPNAVPALIAHLGDEAA